MFGASGFLGEVWDLLLSDGLARNKLDAVPPFLEVALTLVAGVLVLWRPRSLDRPLSRAWRALAALRGGRAVWVSALVALIASAATMLWLGFPVPVIPDEYGHLLIGDTFAHGRLANPMPKVPAAFEETVILVRPTYTSKYPPAQGVVLAAGQLLGHPGIGVVLSVVLLAAACCWFLQGWLPPPWPAVGTALLTLRVGVGSYWGQSYWGGALPAIGGLLLYGALPRLFGRRGRLQWLPLAAGVSLLALSRPVEGALATLPAAAVVAVGLFRQWRRWWQTAFRLGIALGVGAVLATGYNLAVTGDPLRHPYQLHRATYGVDALSPYVAPARPVRYSSPVLAAYFAKPMPRPSSWTAALGNGSGNFARMAYFVCGLPLLVFLVSTVYAARHASLSQARWRWRLFAALCALLPAALYAVTAGWLIHYSAAATGPLMLLALFSMREAAAVRCRGRRLGPWLAAAALLVQLPLTPLTVWKTQRPWPQHRANWRARVEARFAARGDRAVIVVDDRVRVDQEWIYNHADLESAPVLWIQDLGIDATRRVAAAYAPRRILRLVPGEGEMPWRLVPVLEPPVLTSRAHD